jgi:2-oxoglutarate dehydrogenase E2 component (dihydrolipoamide succinyltransferase)
MYRVGRKLARQLFSVPEHYARSWCPTSRRYFISTALAHEDFVMKVPSMGDSITEGTMVEWLKAVGDHAEEDEVIAIVETDKVSVDIRAPSAGTITNIMADVDAIVEVGQDLVSFSTTPGSTVAVKGTDQKPESKSETASGASQGTPEVVVKQTVGRIPLIKFRHGKHNRNAPVGTDAASFNDSEGNQAVGPDHAYFRESGFQFVLPYTPISDLETDFINLGGALDEY